MGKSDEEATTRRARRDDDDETGDLGRARWLTVIGVVERDANMTREARREVGLNQNRQPKRTVAGRNVKLWQRGYS